MAETTLSYSSAPAAFAQRDAAKIARAIPHTNLPVMFAPSPFFFIRESTQKGSRTSENISVFFGPRARLKRDSDDRA